MSQNSMPRRFCSGVSASSSVVAALNPAASTTPVSNRRAGAQLPVPWAIENTSRVAAIAPANAAISIARLPRPRIMTSSAATAAPPELPRIYGSASGLRSRTCIRTPAMASNPPTENAVKARGSRNSVTSDRADSDPEPASAPMASAKPISALPEARANSIESNAMPASAANPTMWRPASNACPPVTRVADNASIWCKVKGS